ncbi:DUF305 domain-containing protein [Spirilliplanes yamanashiensis]|nr:DUF305 domain-containing protein [Spirilliplanes yamanashiensis]MDP9818920.1 uncharacterized protein (DUF305 family) [Spirilliplanes yamanashiensis]
MTETRRLPARPVEPAPTTTPTAGRVVGGAAGRGAGRAVGEGAGRAAVPAVGRAAAALALVLVAGCGGSPAPTASPTAAAPPSATAGPAAPAGSAAGRLNGTDTAWLQLTIAMDEALVPLLDLAPRQSADAAVRALAADVRADHVAALAALRGIRDAAGLGGANPHAGHRMPGMVTPDVVAAAGRATGPAFDVLLRDALLGHLDQCVRVAAGEREAGADPEVRRWAGRIAADRAADRERVAKLR